jgi:hypothetical protein
LAHGLMNLIFIISHGFSGTNKCVFTHNTLKNYRL